MGVVWLARHEFLDREVAVKFLLAAVADLDKVELLRQLEDEGVSLVELREAGIFADEAGADLPGANQVAGVKAPPFPQKSLAAVPGALVFGQVFEPRDVLFPDDPRVLPTGQRIFGHK